MPMYKNGSYGKEKYKMKVSNDIVNKLRHATVSKNQSQLENTKATKYIRRNNKNSKLHHCERRVTCINCLVTKSVCYTTTFQMFSSKLIFTVAMLFISLKNHGQIRMKLDPMSV